MHDYRIEEFPKGDQHWLLTWVGHVSIDENGYRIEVDLVEIDYEQYKTKPTVFSYLKRDTEAKKEGEPKRLCRKIIKSVGIDYIAILDIGSVWRNQQLVDTPINNQSFHTLTVEVNQPDSCIIERVDVVVEKPQKYHPFSALHRQSKCLVIQDNFSVPNEKQTQNQIRKILIPPSELIKFYYCGSGYVIKQLIGTGIQEDQLFVRSDTKINQKSGEVYVNMRKGTVDEDHFVIGRIAGCTTAYKRATSIGKNLLLDFKAGVSPYLAAKFPFSTRTVLTVKGKYIRLDEANSDSSLGFLVYAIQKCTAPFPFTKLWYDRDNNNQQKDEPLEVKEGNKTALKQPSVPADDSLINSISAADRQLKNVRISISFESRFTNMPPAERVQKEHQLVKTLGNTPTYTADFERYTTSGTHSVGNNTAPGTLIPAESEYIGYAYLSAIVAHLREFGFRCKYLKWSKSEWESSESFCDSEFPTNQDGDKSVASWRLYFSSRMNNGDSKRVRRLAIVWIVQGGTSFYLIDCESRPSERFSRVILHIPGQLKMSRPVIEKVIRLLLAHKGIWRNCDVSPYGLVKQAFDHRETDQASSIGDRLRRYINRC